MGIHNAKSSGFDAELERKFSERFGQKYGILMSNGTVTMQAALLAILGWEMGDCSIVYGIYDGGSSFVCQCYSYYR